MSLFGELAQSFVKGALTTLAEQRPTVRTLSYPVEQWCRELGRTVDEWDQRTAFLHFDELLAGCRTVSVRSNEDGATVLMTSSLVVLDAVPPAVAACLLDRSPNLPFGAWTTGRFERGVGIFLTHRTPTEGVTATVFRRACEALVREAHDFDAKMRAAGFLR